MTIAILKRRLEKLETQAESISIQVCRMPDLEVHFVTALSDDSPPVESALTPDMIIELEADEDLNSVALELGITIDELHRQIQRGQVRIVYPPKPQPVAPTPQPFQLGWNLP